MHSVRFEQPSENGLIVFLYVFEISRAIENTILTNIEKNISSEVHFDKKTR